MKKLLSAALAICFLCFTGCNDTNKVENTGNLVLPLLEVLNTEGQSLYFEMKQDAASMMSDSGYESITKQYTLSGLDGFLNITFESSDAAISTKGDNASIHGAIGFYVRGVSPDIFLQAKAELEALGATDWVGHTNIFEGVATLVDTEDTPSVLQDNEVYFLGATLKYEGARYQVIITLLTERQAPYYTDSFEYILGDGWPEVSISISKHEASNEV